jgi:hypothetical protein
MSKQGIQTAINRMHKTSYKDLSKTEYRFIKLIEKREIIGTGIFNIWNECKGCGDITKTDINRFCKSCFISDNLKEMNKEDENE